MATTYFNVPEFEGFYLINKSGEILSKERNGNKNRNRKLMLQTTPRGYKYYRLQKNGFKKTCLLHRILAELFIPNPLNKKYVNHKNGIKSDNNINNLEWVTQSENQLHAYQNGLQKKMYGTDRGRVSKLTEEKVKEIHQLFTKGYKQKDIAKIMKVTPANISNIINRKTWPHVLA